VYLLKLKKIGDYKMKLIKLRNAESWDSKKIRAILIDSERVRLGFIISESAINTDKETKVS